MSRTATTLEVATALVRLDTSPTGSTGDRHDAVDLLGGRLADAGFELRRHEYGHGRINLVARYGDIDRPGPCLTGHLDTVPAAAPDWQRDPWSAEEADGLLHGRGTADMKLGTTAAVDAAVAFVGDIPDTALSVVLTDEEEVGCLGALALVAEGLVPSATCLVVAEPTDLRPRIGHRGAVWADVHGRGRSCHGSTPHLGSNALQTLMDDVTWLSEQVAGSSTHPTLGDATLNLGTMHGGLQRNIVPDRATAEVDVRLADPDLTARLTALDGQELPHGSLLDVVVALAPVATPTDDPLVELAARIADELCGRDGDQSPAARFFTDASVLTPALGGVPTLVWGPGSPDQAHVVDEHCPVAHLDLAVSGYRRLLRALSAR